MSLAYQLIKLLTKRANDEITAVDLDGTLAHYDEWEGPDKIGEPIEPMVKRVKGWLADGKKVVIFTARAHGDTADLAIPSIKKWCKELLGRELEVTCTKTQHIVEFWDDRAIGVVKNTGKEK